MGSSRQQALLTHVIIGVVNVVTTLVAVFTVDSIGRCVTQFGIWQLKRMA